VNSSFVRNMIESPSDKRIVQAVIDLGQNLGLKVVADGIADEDTLDTLTLMGCEFGQGDFIGAPVARANLIDLVETGLW